MPLFSESVLVLAGLYNGGSEARIAKGKKERGIMLTRIDYRRLLGCVYLMVTDRGYVSYKLHGVGICR